MNGKYYESELEQSFIEEFKECGWTYSHGDQVDRNAEDIIIKNDLLDYLSNRYSLSDNTKEEIVHKICTEAGKTQYHSLKKVFTLYRDGYDIIMSDEDLKLQQKGPHTNKCMRVEYIDFENPKNNIFRCINQYTVQYNSGQDIRIPDILLFVNGIPLVIIELKRPTDVKANIYAAWEQIHVRYMRDIPHLMKYCALSCISDAAQTRLGTTYSPYQYYYAWKMVNEDDNPASPGLQQMMTMIGGAFGTERLLKLIRDYTYFPDDKYNKEQEVICRYPQFFATTKLFRYIVKKIKSSKNDGKGGTYFGATGCGKTFTMLFLSRHLQLRAKTSLGSPTIIIIVDRDELQNQAMTLFQNSEEFLSCGKVKMISSRSDLKEELKYRASGGVLICTIQKFCEEIGLLSERNNIICFSDEAHRTQVNISKEIKVNLSDDIETKEKEEVSNTYKNLEKEDKSGVEDKWGYAHWLRVAFPNATFVGFTGTPVKDTIKVFGKVVDKYTMAQSVADGITVKLKYIPRLARVNLNNQKVKEIEDFYNKCENEGASKEDIQESKKNMTRLNHLLGDDERIKRVAADIVHHYEGIVEEKPDVLQKAMVTCSSIPIAWKLYNAIKAIRPEWTEGDVPMLNMVATRNTKNGKNDDLYKFLGDKAHQQKLEENFKDEKSNFKMVIVVDMWITGFDVRSLTVLYNDKPLQKHTLIQTISRVNRVFPGKEYGMIVDYIGIHSKMKEALKMYNGDDIGVSEDDAKLAKATFDCELGILRDLLDGCDTSDFFGDNPKKRLWALSAAAEFVLAQNIDIEDNDGKKQKKKFSERFSEHVRRLSLAYNICKPLDTDSTYSISDNDSVLAQFFMAIAGYLRKLTSTEHDVESMNARVKNLLEETFKFNKVEEVFGDDKKVITLDDNYIEHLKEIELPNTKFMTIKQLLQREISDYSKINKLKSSEFQELLDNVVKEYNNRDNFAFVNKVAGETIEEIQKKVNEKINNLSEQLIKLFNDMNADKMKFAELGISIEEKAFYDILVSIRNKENFEFPDARCIDLSRKIKELIDKMEVNKDWINNTSLKNDLAFELSILLYKEGYPPEWDEEIFKNIMVQVNNYKKYQIDA